MLLYYYIQDVYSKFQYLIIKVLTVWYIKVVLTKKHENKVYVY